MSKITKELGETFKIALSDGFVPAFFDKGYPVT